MLISEQILQKNSCNQDQLGKFQKLLATLLSGLFSNLIIYDYIHLVIYLSIQFTTIKYNCLWYN